MADGEKDVLKKGRVIHPPFFLSQLWRYYFLSQFLN